MADLERRGRIAGILGIVGIVGLLLWWRAGDPGGAGAAVADEGGEEPGRSLLVPRASGSGRALAIPAAARATLRGTVIRPDGRPVAGAAVQILGRPAFAERVPAVTTDGDGSFELTGLLTGRYRLEARHAGEVSPTVAHDLSRLSRPVTLVLVPGASLEVEVVRASDHRPIRGAEVGLWDGDTEVGDVDVARTETTDERGLARFPGVVATSNHAVRVRADGYVDGYVNVIAAAQPTLDGWRQTVVLEPGHTLSGRVVDASGRPVEGALVGFDPSRQVPLPDGIFSPFLRAGKVGTARTDDRGWFRLTVRPGTGCATATAPGHMMGELCDVTVASHGVDREVTIRLESGASIGGVVVDPRGVPVPAATVLVTLPGEELEPMFEHNYRFRTRADERGRFAFSGLDPVQVVVCAFTRDASSPLVEVDLTGGSDARGLEVPLEHGETISGTVVDSSASPVPYATVVYRPDHLVDEQGFDSTAEIERHEPGVSPPRWVAPSNKGAVRADGSGRFRITALDSGAYRLIGSRPGPTSTSPSYGTEQVRPVFPGEDATIVLPALAAVRGRVVAEGGAPVGELGISLALADLGADRNVFPPARRFAGGRFALPEVPAGRYRLRVSGPEIEDTFVGPFAVDGEEVDLGIIEVRRGVRRTGLVLDAEGNPVAGARVTIAAEGVMTSADSGRDGSFSLPTLGTGASLRAKAATENATSGWTEIAPAETRVVLRLTGEPSGGLTGVLVAPGRPLEGRAVAVIDGAASSPEEMPPVAVAQTRPGGLFEIETLPAGRYSLWVYRAIEDPETETETSWIEHTAPVVIRPNEVTDVSVVLPPDP